MSQWQYGGVNVAKVEEQIWTISPRWLFANADYDTMREHARLLCDWVGERIGVRDFRKHATWYTKGFPGSAKLRGKLIQIDTLADLDKILEVQGSLSLRQREVSAATASRCECGPVLTPRPFKISRSSRRSRRGPRGRRSSARTTTRSAPPSSPMVQIRLRANSH